MLSWEKKNYCPIRGSIKDEEDTKSSHKVNFMEIKIDFNFSP